ncbi:hypothetical protein [Bdellovibrio svalbardensis]|uniref:Lipoprotein n=1 Tax=Bdellovibrio svalbardensis TaxID=2972972 RepID=A0ABT6DFB1_9BACT|nr:hypothetical protein [Bdellovibrio svalbardensis]MDG0815517.1 hypothetical protein [Bdellovibrio svalbardensis]
MITIKKLFLAALTLSSLAACSENGVQIIKGADLKAEVQQGDIYVDLTTHLDSNNVQILAVQLPIYNPENPLEQLGLVSIATPSQGVTDISLELNLSKVAKLQSLTPEKGLPNGTAFPVWGVNANNWYSLPLNNSKTSKLYVNIEGTLQKAVVGYALVSDSLSAGVTANIFAPFNAQGVSGYGGIFSGVTPGTSGVAVFADISSVFKAINPTFVQAKSSSQSVYFLDRTSDARKKPLFKRLIDLNLKKAKVKIK